MLRLKFQNDGSVGVLKGRVCCRVTGLCPPMEHIVTVCLCFQLPHMHTHQSFVRVSQNGGLGTSRY